MKKIRRILFFFSFITAFGSNSQGEVSKGAFINWFGNNKLRTAGIGIAALGFGAEKLLTKFEHDRCARKNESMNQKEGRRLENKAFDSLMDQRLQRGWKIVGDIEQIQYSGDIHFSLERKTGLGKTIKERWVIEPEWGTCRFTPLRVKRDEKSKEINKISHPDSAKETNVFVKRHIEGNIAYIPWVKRALIGMGVVSFACSFWPSSK
ncbi:hypothetical protein HYX58_02855 [Candidatus Dependentiae bacterium]|nr:hypothetical protein [Candidatus Dependentiae bacterium]